MTAAPDALPLRNAGPAPAGEPSRDVLLPESLRIRLGASAETPSATLNALALDPQRLVRAAVAANPAISSATEQALAADPDCRVRELLARRLAALLPSLDEDGWRRARAHVQDLLYRLAADEAERVRGAVAEVVADMPQAPRALILRLARDAAVPVSEPVLRLSPVLTDADLIGLLVEPPNAAAAAAIARRTHVSEALSDAVVCLADTQTVRALLANPGAALREATLDALLAQALAGAATTPRSPAADPPRPASSPVAALLRGLVVDEVLDAVRRHRELGPEVAVDLRRRLASRLPAETTSLMSPAATSLDGAAALEAAFLCQESGGLGEAALLTAAGNGEARLLAALLSVAAGVPLGVVERAARLRSAKGLVSLIWKAGFSMRVAGPVQAVLARLAPPQLMLATADGAFPLQPQEMRWQVHFLSHAGW